MKISASPALFFRVSLTLGTASLLFIVMMAYSYLNEKQQKRQEAKYLPKQEAVRAAQKIDAELQKLSGIALGIANDITTEKLAEDGLEKRLLAEIESNPKISGLAASYKPFTYPRDAGKFAKIPLYSPYYIRAGDKIEYRPIEEYYAYTLPQYEWYHKPQKKGATWVKPFFSEISNNMLVAFGAPFYHKDPDSQKEDIAGVVSVNYSWEDIEKLMKSLTIGKTGYGFLISQEGNFIYHPSKNFIEETSHLLEPENKALQDKHKLLLEASKKAIAGESVEIDDRNEETGQSTWVFFEPIPSTGWALGVVFIKDEIFTENNATKHKPIWIALGSISCLFFFSIILFRAYKGSLWGLWAVSISTSVFLSGGIGFIWYLSFIERPDKNTEGTVILSEEGLQSFLESRAKIDRKLEKTSAIQIPTGLFIQSMEFQGANNVFIAGYLWQKFPKSFPDIIPDEETAGFVLPEAITSADFEPIEAYRFETETHEVIGWYFEAILRQNFNYNRYPFDSKDIWVRIWTSDFYKNILLVPDLDSYSEMNPTSIPGVEKDFVFPGWHLESSFFQYRINEYNTYFGFELTNADKVYQEFPELYFTIIAKRNFLTVFISNVMPSMVLACLLFFIQMLLRKNTGDNEALSFSAMEIVSTSGAFIFIVILDQINLRNSISTGGIIYIEFFYFILYVLILLVTLNALLLASRTKMEVLNYKDNLIPKLLYWPFFLKVLLIFTVLVFY